MKNFFYRTLVLTLIQLLTYTSSLLANNSIIYTDENQFLQTSGASLIVSFPDTKVINTTSYVENGVTIAQANGLGNGINDYTTKLEGNELAVNGPEHINITFTKDIRAFGIRLYDKNSKDGSCPAADSKFDVTIKYDNIVIDTLHIDPPVDEYFFFGVISIVSFNKVEFREVGALIDETYGTQCEDDFFGHIFISEATNCIYIDSDKDGVIDQWDFCPDTPLNVATLSNGCQIIKGDVSNNGKLDVEDSIKILQLLTTNIPPPRNYKSCKEILENDYSSIDGTYTIDPDGIEENPPFEVFCDMTTSGGGWTLVAKSTGKETTKLTGDDKTSWLEKNYFGDISNLLEETALGKSYHTVAFQDIMIQSLNDSSKLLAWSHPTPISNLYSIIKSGKPKIDGNLIQGNIHELDYRSGCSKGEIPKSLYYGIFVSDVQNLNNMTSLGLFTTKGWLHSVIGWGSTADYVAGNNLSGGFGIKNYSGYLWALSRHVHGIGNGCNATEWSSSKGKGSQTLKGHALFIR